MIMEKLGLLYTICQQHNFIELMLTMNFHIIFMEVNKIIVQLKLLVLVVDQDMEGLMISIGQHLLEVKVHF